MEKPTRRTNNTGLNQVRRGKTYEQVRRMARRLRVPFALAKAQEVGAGAYSAYMNGLVATKT